MCTDGATDGRLFEFKLEFNTSMDTKVDIANDDGAEYCTDDLDLAVDLLDSANSIRM